MAALKLRKIGNSLGVILPQEMLARTHVAGGHTIFLTEAPGGVTPYDPDFEQQMTRARRIMRKRRNVLRELAK